MWLFWIMVAAFVMYCFYVLMRTRQENRDDPLQKHRIDMAHGDLSPEDYKKLVKSLKRK